MTVRDLAAIIAEAYPGVTIVPSLDDMRPEGPGAVCVKARDDQYCWMQIDPDWAEAPTTAIPARMEGLLALVEEHGGPVAIEAQEGDSSAS